MRASATDVRTNAYACPQHGVETRHAKGFCCKAEQRRPAVQREYSVCMQPQIAIYLGAAYAIFYWAKGLINNPTAAMHWFTVRTRAHPNFSQQPIEFIMLTPRSKRC
jgi:hypothetical protein